MDTAGFFRAILPATGLYVAARLTSKGFRNTICRTIEELTQQVLFSDSQGVTTYHACAAYREEFVMGVKDGKPIKRVRTHDNVRALKCFYMDLDVKPGNPTAFQSQSQALDQLIDFCKIANLPIPMIVSSGGGIHIYWTLTDEILPEVWKPVAEGFKQLAVVHGFKADPACTADSARVLRPVGTVNRKDPGNPRWVELVADGVPTGIRVLEQAVQDGCRSAGVAISPPIKRVEAPTETVNQDFAIRREFPPCSGEKVATRCAQLAKVRNTRGDVSEPLWYAAIQLLCHAIEGDELIHRWSDGYRGYSVDETSRKISQVRGQSLGPTLCSTFESRAPGGCDGCPFRGKISSPAQLGTHIVSAPAPVIEVKVAEVVTQVTLPTPPLPFTRAETGGIVIEEDGITHKIYEYDAFPVELAFDEQLGYETMRIRHWLPQEGWKECVLQSSLLARPVDFETKLRDQHIQPLIRAKMAMYFDSYIRKMRTDTKLRKLFKSQGWKSDETEFVLGDKLYRPGEIVQAGFSHAGNEFLTPFQTRGSLAQWRTLTQIFSHSGLEPHAFMLLLAFAGPLLKLANREGCTVNALGESGVGKSTMAQFMSSVYSTPKGSWIGRDDTALARMQRLGAHNSLPVYMDEATTIAPKELRDLIYSIPTGKNRTSMRQDYTVRQGAEWSTLFITSTNASLQSRLQLANQNPEAEGLRLFEFLFPRVAAFAPLAKIIPNVVRDHHGVAGAAYIEYLVNHRDDIRHDLASIVGQAEAEFGMDDKERFWSQIVALTLYGGRVARQAGVIDFDANVIRPWLHAETRRLRRNLGDSLTDEVSILAEYLNRTVGSRLVVTKINASMGAVSQRPLRELTCRFEQDTKEMFIDKRHIKEDLDTLNLDYNATRDALLARGVLVSDRVKKTLGAGTDLTGAPTTCWRVRMDHPDLAVKIEAAV